MEESNNLIASVEELFLTISFYFMRGYTVDKVDSDVLEEVISLLLLELKSREENVH